jgi:hypothetical protein
MRRYGAVIFLITLTLAPGLAWAGDYDARILFLEKKIDSFDALPEHARAQLKEGLEKYADARVKLFEELIKTMEANKADKEAWKKQAEKGKDLPKVIFERLDSAGKGGGFAQVDELNKLLQQEVAFYAKLAAGNLSGEHEVILQNTQGLQEMIKALDKKWGGVLYLDERVDDDWELYWKEVIDVLEEFRDEMTRAVDDYVKTLKTSPAAAGGKVAEWANKMAGKLKIIDGIFLAAKQSLKRTHDKAMRQVAPKEFDVVQVFLNNRRRAKEFVDKHGLHHAEKAFARAENKADRTCDSLQGEGLEKDCQILYVKALAKLNVHYERAEEENDRFLEENQGRFLGGVDSSVRGALLEQDEWDRWGGRVPARQVVDLVKKMDSEYFRDPPWKGGGLSDAVRQEIKNYLDDSWLKVANEDTVFLKTLQENDFKKVIEHRRKLANQIDRG